ncbi:MAG TPA: hypothetical protein VMH87_18405 [Pseudomonadales bacterium]|nr:hypothetical protein [Pseudomonadales bacterium]
MNLRLASFKTLLFAGLAAGFCLIAKAQSNSEQSILFSTPDGRSVSNALLPAATAPGTSAQAPNLPDNNQASFNFTVPQPGQGIPLPQPAHRSHLPGNADIRNHMGMETPAEAMGVPTIREMFGLPKAKATNSLARLYGNSTDRTTNGLDSSSTTTSDDNWGKILSSDSDAFNSARTTDSNRLNSGFFDSADSDGFSRAKKVGNEKAGDDSDNSSAPANDRLSAWGTPAQIAAPPNLPGYNVSGYTPPAAASAPPAYNSTASWNSQTPFAVPKVSSFETTTPQLPSVPSAQKQSPPSQPAAPSWAPKPPPWLDPTPPLGTMAQRKF